MIRAHTHSQYVEGLIVIRILFIDDEEALLEIAKVFLEQEKGFKIVTSLSAQEALDRLKRDRFDVIVSDYQMPGMNGIELLKKLKSAGDTTPYILFTGRGREDVAIDALNNGASFYLQKGGDPKSQFAELVNMIETSARQARAEKTLREEKDRAQQYLNLAGVMLVALDKHGKVTRINKKGCEILGYEEDQILGKSWFESFLPESRRDEVKVIFDGQMRGGIGPQEHQPSVPVLCRGGVERRIVFARVLLKNEKGEIVGTLSSGEDVTERELAEAALRVSLAKYTTLFESLPLGVTISDREGNIVESNRAAERLLGLSREDQVKRQIDGREWRIVRRDGSPMPASEYASVRAMKENRRVSDVEMGIVKDDGPPTWVNVTAAPIPLAGYGVAIAYSDITERKLAEEILRTIEDKYRQLVELAQEGIWVIDADANTTYVNPRMAEMLGYTSGEMMGRPIFAFMDERGKEIAQMALDRRQGIREHHDFEFLLKDGQRIYASLETSPLMDEAGNYTGSMAVVADITERKRTEDALRESEKRYRLLIESASEAIIVAQDGMIRVVNPMTLAITGLSKQELMSKPFPAFVHPDDRAMVVDTYQRRLRGEAVPARYAFRLLAKDGIIKWVEISAVAIDWEGRPATLNFLTDITERKQVADALRESEELYHKLVEGMLEGVAYCQMLYDDRGHPVDWIYLNVNSNFVTLTGLHDMVGKRVTEAIPGIEKSNPELFEIYGRVASSGKPEVFENEIKLLRIWLKVSVFCPEKDHFVAIFEDITKRKQTEDALKKSEMKYRQLVELAQEGIWAIDADANTTYVNPRMAEMFGYTPEEMMGRHLFSFMDERGKEIAQTNLDRRKQGIKEQHDFEFLRKDGQRIYARLETAPIMDGAGNYTGALAVVADITERKKSEVVIAESLEKRRELESIIDKSPAIAFIWKHVPEWSVVFVSNNIKQFGYMPEDFTSRRLTYADLVHPEDMKRVFGESEEYAKKGVSEFTQEYRILTKSGDVRWVDDRTVILRNTAGESVFHQGIIFDITEQRRVERALRQANEKLSLLGSITRHDAINQLSVMMAWLDIAKEVGKDLPIMDQLTRVQESARILQRQLEFTAEYQELGVRQPQWISLRDAADAGTEGVDLGAVSIKYDLKGAEVFADPMLEKMFHNLVDNSLRHGEKVTQIRFYCKESNEGLVIICEDDGVGVPVDEKERIFERGFGKHTGLGLYLVRAILGITGIVVKETGEPGTGARFELLVSAGNYRIGHPGQ
jgi:PAS domain S-box-containing protein